jgi:hypothetical protein
MKNPNHGEHGEVGVLDLLNLEIVDPLYPDQTK